MARENNPGNILFYEEVTGVHSVQSGFDAACLARRSGRGNPAKLARICDFASALRLPRGEGERETYRARAPADFPSAEPGRSKNVPNGKFYSILLCEIGRSCVRNRKK